MIWGEYALLVRWCNMYGGSVRVVIIRTIVALTWLLSLQLTQQPVFRFSVAVAWLLSRLSIQSFTISLGLLSFQSAASCTVSSQLALGVSTSVTCLSVVSVSLLSWWVALLASICASRVWWLLRALHLSLPCVLLFLFVYPPSSKFLLPPLAVHFLNLLERIFLHLCVQYRLQNRLSMFNSLIRAPRCSCSFTSTASSFSLTFSLKPSFFRSKNQENE